ncbi:nucleotide sugar dehydrogenase [Arthrobacter pascens]|uniref:nucleotide sugar dehydrogenase n=1 Tax=Arthrobacter pascens TaxID=1677 RepID=UPI002863EEF1|nr:nucleotide sugar dehydrogenase [Arthrobacter pascens]MDR6555732.1 nucleotide sugar dehydrogenase [Arthrobacter pascens]
MSLNKQKVVVVGQGYVGLPVAMRAVQVGYKVVGIDVDKRRVDGLRNGVSYVEDISNEELRAAIASGNYVATDDYQDAVDFDVAVITVPTPLRESVPDLSYIEESAESLAAHLTVGSTVILESTTYPGTTEELLVPILERGSGLRSAGDFYVGYSPERIDPGNKTWGFVETPKVVSGLNAQALERVRDFYDSIVETTVPVSSPREAEMTKLLENTFRHVNIALVNELAIFANQLGVNVWESIEAASTKPFGFMKFTPGPGVGGHCLPVDPSYLSWQVRRKLGQNFRFVELANDINDHMPDYVLQRLMMLLNKQARALSGSHILLCGLSYKRDSGDIRESPSLRLIELLLEAGAIISAVDHHVETYRWPDNVRRVELDSSTLEMFDASVLVTDHTDVDYELLVSSDVPVLDTRNRLKGANVELL